ncbi:hypothetical protein VP01_287g1 [Puccinia sorghi]|uniref:Uncharacterized protein n=1 Tax=Puccinia sorghi TaxID=27349 RepID=A0A0L6V1P2_9BASI|nr:hypothetical protein VP01_287g1 [Puccinia sorghi]
MAQFDVRMVRPSLALRWILSDLPLHTLVHKVNSLLLLLEYSLKVVAARLPPLTSSQSVQVLANYSSIIIHIRTAQLSLLSSSLSSVIEAIRGPEFNYYIIILGSRDFIHIADIADSLAGVFFSFIAHNLSFIIIRFLWCYNHVTKLKKHISNSEVWTPVSKPLQLTNIGLPKIWNVNFNESIFVFCSKTLTCSILQPSFTVQQIFVESLFEKCWSNNISFLGLDACQLQAVDQFFFTATVHFIKIQDKNEKKNIGRLAIGDGDENWVQSAIIKREHERNEDKKRTNGEKRKRKNIHHGCFHGTCMQFFLTGVDVMSNSTINLISSFHLKNKSYISFSHPIFLVIIFKFQNNLCSPFYELDILFLCYDHIENVDKSLASEPPSISKYKSIRTKLNKTNTTLPNNKNLICSLDLNQPDCEIHDITQLVVGGSLKHPPTSANTRAWKAKKISSASKSLIFPPWKMSRSQCHSSPTLSSNLPRLLKPLCPQLSAFHHNIQLYVMNHNIIKLNSPLGYSSNHCDCIIEKGILYLGGGFDCFQHEIKQSCNLVMKYLYSPQIRLKLCTNYNQHTTGFSSVFDQFHRKHLHASAMETALVIKITREKNHTLLMIFNMTSYFLRELDDRSNDLDYCSELHSHSRGLGLWQRNAQATEISTHRNIQHTLTQDPDSTLRLLCFSTDTRKGHFPWHIPQPSLGSQMRHHPLSHPSGRKFTLSHPHTENNHPSHTFPGHMKMRIPHPLAHHEFKPLRQNTYIITFTKAKIYYLTRLVSTFFSAEITVTSPTLNITQEGSLSETLLPLFPLQAPSISPPSSSSPLTNSTVVQDLELYLLCFDRVILLGCHLTTSSDQTNPTSKLLFLSFQSFKIQTGLLHTELYHHVNRFDYRTTPLFLMYVLVFLSLVSQAYFISFNIEKSCDIIPEMDFLRNFTWVYPQGLTPNPYSLWYFFRTQSTIKISKIIIAVDCSANKVEYISNLIYKMREEISARFQLQYNPNCIQLYCSASSIVSVRTHSNSFYSNKLTHVVIGYNNVTWCHGDI